MNDSQLGQQKKKKDWKSKFFIQGNVSSDSDSDKSEQKKNANRQYNRKIRDIFDDESQESQSEKKILRTNKQKWQAKIQKSIKIIHKKIIHKKFFDIYQEYQKVVDLAEKYVKNNNPYPRIVIKLFKYLIELLDDYDEQVKEKLSTANNKAFNILKQKIKKQMKKYPNDVKAYQQNPIKTDQQQKKQEQEQSSSEQEQQKRYFQNQDPNIRVLFWLKKQKRQELQKTGRISLLQVAKIQKNQKKQQVKDQKKTEIEKAPKVYNLERTQKIQVSRQNANKLFKKIRQDQKAKLVDKIELMDQVKKFVQEKDKMQTLIQAIAMRTDYQNQKNQINIPYFSWYILMSDLQELIRIDEQMNEQTLNFLYSTYIILQRQINRAFAITDPMSLDYGKWMNGLFRLLQFATKLFNQYRQRGQNRQVGQIALGIIQNTYCFDRYQIENIPPLQDLFSYPVKGTKLTLYHCYFLSLHDKYNQAKDQYLYGKASFQINTQYLKILNNRVLSQLGLSAFRNKKFHQVGNWLSDLCSYGRTRQFINQHPYNKNLAIDIRKKPIPYHQYLSINQIQSVEMLCAMLNQKNYGSHSKSLKKILDYYQKIPFVGYPTSYRDLLHSLYKSLGNPFPKDYLSSLLYQTMTCGSQKIKELVQKLSEKFKQRNIVLIVTVKIWLQNKTSMYKNIGLKDISEMFELDIKIVQKIVYECIFEGSIRGKINMNGYIQFQNKKNQFNRYYYEMIQGIEEYMAANEYIEKVQKKKK